MRDLHERGIFLNALLARCIDYRQTYLTLTAIHPDGKHPTPSRHIPLADATALQIALAQLDSANALGWGAYFAVGLRRPGLTRWKRGGSADVVALPALFVDVDDLSSGALEQLQHIQPAPSCIVASGGGYHACWWLDEPTTDLTTARLLLRGLAVALDGDPLSVAQSLRIIQSFNTKPSRESAVCRLLDINERRYAIHDFTTFLPRPTVRQPPRTQFTTPDGPSSDLIARVTQELVHCGCKARGDWVNGACPFPERHKHGDQHPSFGFNTRTGYGFCHVCGTLLLKDLCVALSLQSSLGVLPRGNK
ncbi:MAG: hypothetical protein H7Z43_12075 [Clostridia bacterium]|nr:hypothetical protein [Deltaproteobacteria bacterium]